MFQFVSRRIGGLCSRGGTGGCGRGAPILMEQGENNRRSSPSRKQAEEMLFPVLHNPGEKNWRSIPSPGGTAEDLLQRLGEKNWRSSPTLVGTVEVADLLQRLGETAGDLFLVVDGLESVVPMLQHLSVHGGEGRNPGSIAKHVESTV
jgi:hypothetical protein